MSQEMVAKEAQGGFRKGRGCADQIFILRSVVELRKKQGPKAMITFLDVRKACDTMWREFEGLHVEEDEIRGWRQQL